LTWLIDRLQEARQVIKRLQTLLADISVLLRPTTPAAASGAAALASVLPAAKWHAADAAFYSRVVGADRAVAAALHDDFDTPAAMKALLDLATATRAYLALPNTRSGDADAAGSSSGNGSTGGGAGGSPLPQGLLHAASGALQRHLRTFGLQFAEGDSLAATPGAGSTLFAAASSGASGSADSGGAGAPSADAAVAALLQFRQQVRGVAGALGKAVKAADKAGGGASGEVAAAVRASAAALLHECDAVRDTTLPAMGLRLKDTPAGPVATPASGSGS
jgi:cysteinyl-tRNA synthetase